VAICPSCGEENPDRFRLCGFCGTSLAAAAAPRETRKLVTVVFSDLQESANLGDMLDSEVLESHERPTFRVSRILLYPSRALSGQEASP
jgi:Double zinc ribbon